MKVLKNIRISEIKDFIEPQKIILIADKKKYLLGYHLGSNFFIRGKIQEDFILEVFENFEDFKKYILSFNNNPLELFIQIESNLKELLTDNPDELYEVLVMEIANPSSIGPISFAFVIFEHFINHTNKILFAYGLGDDVYFIEIDKNNIIEYFSPVFDEVLKEKLINSDAAVFRAIFE